METDEQLCARGVHHWVKVKPGRGRKCTGLAECSLCGQRAIYEEGAWKLAEAVVGPAPLEREGRP